MVILPIINESGEWRYNRYTGLQWYQFPWYYTMEHNQQYCGIPYLSCGQPARGCIRLKTGHKVLSGKGEYGIFRGVHALKI